MIMIIIIILIIIIADTSYSEHTLNKKKESDMESVDPWKSDILRLSALSADSSATNWKIDVLSRFTAEEQDSKRIRVQFLVFTGNNWCSVCKTYEKKIMDFVSAIQEVNLESDSLKSRIESASGQRLEVTGVTHVDFGSYEDFTNNAKNQKLPGNVRIDSVPSIFVVSRYVTAGPFISRLNLEYQAIAYSVADLLETHRVTKKMAARAAVLELCGRIVKESPEANGTVPPELSLYVVAQVPSKSSVVELNLSDLQMPHQTEIAEEYRYMQKRTSLDELVCDLFMINTALRKGIHSWQLIDTCLTEPSVTPPLSSQLFFPQDLWELSVREVQLALPVPQNCVLKK